MERQIKKNIDRRISTETEERIDEVTKKDRYKEKGGQRKRQRHIGRKTEKYR